MYLSQQQQEAWKEFLTPDEFERLDLWGKLKETKFFKILENSTIQDVTISDNSYGEFMFIHFHFKGHDYFAYGLGIHEQRQVKFIKTWNICSDDFYGENKNLKLYQVMKQIHVRKKQIKPWKVYPDEHSRIFNQIADSGDDDAALTILGY